MTDGRIKGRVKGLFGGAGGDDDMIVPPNATGGLTDADAERQALQVLVLARRTADEHVASALHEAERIRLDARAKADGIAKDAAAHAEGVRREAEKTLIDARAKAESIAKDAAANAEGVRREAERTLVDARAKAQEIARDAQGNAEGVRRDAEKVLVDAKAAADGVAKDAKAKAEELEREAKQRYQEVVGSLEAQRSSLQEQIDTLQQFDKDYRSRLRTFMHSQLRALGVDDEPSNPNLEPLPTPRS